MTTPAPVAQARVPELDTFAARLAAVRHLNGWNIKEAARACGLPAQSWRGWEVGGRLPHNLIVVAMAIATTGRVDLDWLVYGPSRGKVRAEATPEYPHRRDPLAARVISRTGQVRHEDGRRKPAGRVTAVRSTQRPSTSTSTRRPVSLSPLR